MTQSTTTKQNKAMAKALVDGFPWANLKGSKNGLRTCWVEVTPEIAQGILDNLNDNNRPISENKVDEYAIVMNNGAWGIGESNICISNTYRLLNGQHRLAAVIRHGKPVGFTIMFGLTNAEFLNMDAGKKRTVAQKLVIGGVATKNATQLEALATYLLEYTNGGIGGYSSNPTPDEKYKCAQKWVVEFQKSIGWVKANLKRYKIASADAAFAHFCILNGKLKNEGKNFIDQFTSYINGDISKYNLTKNGDDSHPIVALADQFTKEIGMKVQDQHINRIGKGVHIMEAFTRSLAGERFRRFEQVQWTSKNVIGDFDIA
jgi:hypothetical protein